ncbi:MAG: hypothetical protein VX346_13655 [Planctomycetota bacterium]|nr:hypothetical protein [Planctomycetota bacterium]
MALLLQAAAVDGILVVLAIVAILAGIGGFFYMKYRKGSIELRLSRHTYSPGDTLDGTLVVTPRQDLFVDEVYVDLICTAHWYSYSYDSNNKRRRRSHSEEEYRYTHEIARGVSLTSGNEQTFPFDFEVTRKARGRLSDSSHSEGFLAGLISSGRDRYRYEWRLAARLDMKGLDLTTSESVRIS